jgi:hypothetical protein
MTVFEVINLSALASAPKGEINIVSLEGDVYAVYFRRGGQQVAVLNEKGEALTFRSLGAARKALTPLPYASAILVQASAYDEMIGQPGKGDNRLTIEISLGAVDSN